jgi:hypothetical protein
MKEKVKLFGLTLAAVLAMGGVMAQLAQAGSFEAESYPVAIHGNQIEGKHLFKTVASELSCNTYDFQGELGEASNELALTAMPLECSTLGTLTMTVTMNGCTFNFNVGEKISEGSVHIACPAGKEIVWKASNGCTAKIPAQTIKAEVTLTNTATKPVKTIALTTVASGIHYTIEKGGFCVGAPASGSYADGVYEGATTLTGENPKTSEAVGITVK